MRSLGAAEIQNFVDDGFVRIDGAFPRELADEGRAILARDLGCDPGDPTTWSAPIIRLGDYAQEPFRRAVNTPALHAAFDQIVGPGRWLPRSSLGTFPIRFPVGGDPGDTGWHVDASFPGEGSRQDDYASWRVNVSSRGRALLMLFLFSDVWEDDAPTRIRVGSHRDVGRRLAAAGEAGLLPRELNLGARQPETLATGAAGTVYLCHPFLVHAAQAHRGLAPRFMAQPPLHPAEPLRLSRPDGSYSPVEIAIREALSLRSNDSAEPT